MNPADNPKEQRRMEGNTETDETDAESEENTNPLRDTGHTNGGGETDVSGLLVGVRNETTYYVGNPESGTAYIVNMCDPEHEDEMTCTCPDYRYRVSPDEDGACKHILAVISEMPAYVGVEQVAYQGLKTQYELLESKVDSVVKDLTTQQANAVPQTQQNTSDTPSNPPSDTQGSGQQSESVSAEEAAEKLQAAYDEQVSGMNVHVKDGVIWPNNTPEAPDWVFDAFLKKKLEWDKDGRYQHPKVGPNDYELTNYIDPSDVDAYISEVLE